MEEEISSLIHPTMGVCFREELLYAYFLFKLFFHLCL